MKTLAALVVLLVAMVPIGLGVRHFTGREIPSAATAETSVANGFGVSAARMHCTRLYGHYWDYACTWSDGRGEHNRFRFEGSRISDDNRAWG